MEEGEEERFEEEIGRLGEIVFSLNCTFLGGVLGMSFPGDSRFPREEEERRLSRRMGEG